MIVDGGPVALAATLCLPAPGGPVQAMLLIGGTGGDTRDGDPDPPTLVPPAGGALDGAVPARSGLIRELAHRLAVAGVASVRYDKRGCGRSGGRAAGGDYDTDTTDALAVLDWLLGQPEFGTASRVGVVGHSAGAMIACRVAGRRPGLGGVGLLGALYGPAEDMIERNWGRVARYWPQLGQAQRAWLVEHRPADVARGFGVEQFLAAVARGEDSVRLAAHGTAWTGPTRRARHDIHQRRPAGELRPVQAPTLVLHGGEDLNVRVVDALDTYRALRAAGNTRTELVILPGVDHSFRPVAADRLTAVWERISGAALHRQIDDRALAVVANWAARTLATTPGPTVPGPAAAPP